MPQDHMSGPDGCTEGCPACAEEAQAELANITPQLTTRLHVVRTLHVEVPAAFTNPFEHLLIAYTPGNEFYRLKDGIPVSIENVQALLDEMEAGDVKQHDDIKEFLLAALQYAQVHEANEFLFVP